MAAKSKRRLPTPDPSLVPERPDSDGVPDALEDELEEDGDSAPYLARLVLESELLETGRAAPTGIHLALWGPDCAGLDAWSLGLMWGWTDPELADLRANDEQFVLVLQTPGERWGEATAEVLISLLLALRPDEAVNATPEQFLEALRLPAPLAEERGLREAQRALRRVFGLRDPLFGTGRIPGPDEPSSPIPMYIDTQLDASAVNGLLPGSCALVDEYTEMPTLVRLKWPAEGDE
jgi:hypothetical protein